ncbi:uncharacterized protein J8A68_003246 [[Candida] subhashii]|uniref:Uncharacterized protein n=1 Tax=[Candida] subhashii TaxID=561895 RepID=A0A8J5QET7_9ASCO|nr:uncharacterized protein J8A68_003246 [[Candida] subhashii]KAG7663246.1 hypothetical protein J8A68_003246 [[Candida] subhashii]
MHSAVHSAVSLDYSFPKPYQHSRHNYHVSGIPSDIILSKNLKISDEPTPTAPKYSKIPISKIFRTNTLSEDPLDNILEQSKRIISNYKLELPYKVQSDNASTPKKNNDTAQQTTIRSKRKRQISQDDKIEILKNEIENATSSKLNTPIPNKTIFFSPSSSVKRDLKQSTPVSVRNDAQLNMERPSKKFLRLDKAIVVKDHQQKETGDQVEYHSEEVDDSHYDELACHADNILRMAVDSTMLGSTFDGSFSINNTFANYSILDDKDDYDRSVLEILQSRQERRLDKSKFINIEINADDIKAAVHGM